MLRFHAKERHGNGTTFRWSRDVSYITLVDIPASARTLTLVLDDGHRPPGVAPAVLSVAMNGHSLGTLAVGRNFQTYTLPIPPAVAAEAAARSTPSRLMLSSNVWRPRAAIGTPDDRDLGVMVDKLEVR